MLEFFATSTGAWVIAPHPLLTVSNRLGYRFTRRARNRLLLFLSNFTVAEILVLSFETHEGITNKVRVEMFHSENQI